MNEIDFAFLAVIGAWIFLIMFIYMLTYMFAKYVFKFNLVEWIFSKIDPNQIDEFECNDTRRQECWDNCCAGNECKRITGNDSKPANKTEVQP